MVYVETDAVVTVARLTCSVLHCKPDSSIITFTTMLFSETKAAITQSLFGLVCIPGLYAATSRLVGQRLCAAF